MSVIGITGYARSGKDEFAKSLKLRGGYETIAFSDPLADMAYVLNPLLQYDDGALFEYARVVDIYGYTQAKEIPSVREYLQKLGTDAVRSVLGEDVWVRAASQTIMSHAIDGMSTAITGVRFANECEMVKAHGGIMVKIVRPGVGSVNDHISDSGIDTLAVDHVVYNDGTLQDLANKAQALLYQLGV